MKDDYNTSFIYFEIGHFFTFSRISYYARSYGQTKRKTLRFDIGGLHSNHARERDTYWPISELHLCKAWLVMFEQGSKHNNLANIINIKDLILILWLIYL